MNASRNTKLGVVAAAVVALAATGAAFAASKHGGSPAASPASGSFVSSQSGGTPAHRGPGHCHGDAFSAAASYLGLTQAELQTQLEAGKTLGGIADATSGKSKAGLIAALVAAEKEHLAQAVEDGKLTQAQADQITASLTQRVTDLVSGVRPAHGPFGHHDHGPGHDLAAAATYLGLTQAELRTQLEAGKTLGQIADATTGTSKAGLIAALVAAAKDDLAQAVKDGMLTQTQADQMTSNLTQRVADLVDGVRPAHDGPHRGPGFGFGPPPTNSSTHI